MPTGVALTSSLDCHGGPVVKVGKRTRLAVEVLEDRAVPAVAASVLEGSLVVTGDSSYKVVITASDSNSDKVADTFKVVDGSTTVGTFRGVSKDLSVRLDAGNNDLTIDLGGLAAPRDVRVALGGGNDALALVNGTVKGDVRVHGGFGTDKVALGGATLLAVNGNVNADLGGAAGDSFQLKGQAAVKGSLTALGVTSAALDAGSVVGHNVFLSSGGGGVAARLDGQVGGDARVLAAFFGGAGSTLSVTGKVGGGVLFVGGDKADRLSVTGTVAGDLTALLGRGD